jgi:hypothetical protein
VNSTYYFTDKNVDDRSYYYRLKQIDFDGKSSLSGIILLKRVSEKSTVINVLFPNPFSNTLSIVFNSSVKEEVKVEMYDIAGKKVYEFADIPDNILLQLDLSNTTLRQGTYLLKITSGNFTEVKRVMKK